MFALCEIQTEKKRCILNALQRERSFTYTLSVRLRTQPQDDVAPTTFVSRKNFLAPHRVVLVEFILLRSSPSFVYLQENKKAMDYTSHETGHECAILKYTKREIVCVLVFECVKNRLITRTTLSFSTRNLTSEGGGVLIASFFFQNSQIITRQYLITGRRLKNSLSLSLSNYGRK